MNRRHGRSAARIAGAALILLFAGGMARAAQEGSTDTRPVGPDPAVAPAPPPTKKALEKKIKAADQDARDAARRARHFQRIADEATRRGDTSKAEFNQKVADGFIRERDDALGRAAEARRMLEDLKAGRTPQAVLTSPVSPQTPMVEDPAIPGSENPGQPVAPPPGVPDVPSPGAPETPTQPAPAGPGGDRPTGPDPAAPPSGGGGALTIRGMLEALADPDNHPHTFCAKLLLLPVVGRILLERLELTLGDNPTARCPLDCEGEDDEACTGECYGTPLIEGKLVLLKVELARSLVERRQVPDLSTIPVVGKLFVRFPPDNDRELILQIRPTLIRAE